MCRNLFLGFGFGSYLIIGIVLNPAYAGLADSAQPALKAVTDGIFATTPNGAPIEVLKSVVLGKDDIVPGHGFLIRNSNITLDCAGQTIDGLGRATYGVSIDSQGHPLSNVVVKNCTFVNFKADAINVGWLLENYKKQLIAKDDAAMYALHPKNVTLINNKYLGSGNSGVYVNAYAQNVSILNSFFNGNQGPSIYLEYSSKSSRILNSTFYHNGFGKTREAIAIDSSTDNVVKNNRFDGNYSGGIFLYKNCGERHSLSQIPIIRKQGANRNVIEDNMFQNEKVGVWLAARQSHDLSKQMCADPSIFEGKFYQDYASDNKVVGNSFCNVRQAVIVEDNNNLVENNRVDSQPLDRAVRITNPPRAIYLHEPVVGTVISGNVQAQCQ